MTAPVSAINFRVWTTQMIEKLKELWWGGARADDIAPVIGASSAKAVSRKVQREGFQRNPALTILPVTECEMHHNKKEPEPVIRPNGQPVTMLDVARSECQWIQGVPAADAPMCGHTVFRGHYCAHHFARAHA